MIEITKEIEQQLSAPVPSNEIQVKRQGGADIRFTSDKFVINRLDEVLGKGNWSEDYVVTPCTPYEIPYKKQNKLIVGQVKCLLSVGGTTKAAVADMEVSEGMYGTPATNAQAKAFKRAAMKWGIARELWDKEHAADDDDEQPRQQRQTTARPAAAAASTSTSRTYGSNGTSKPSDKQMDLLIETLYVPEDYILHNTRHPNFTKQDASALIEALLKVKNTKKDFEQNHAKYVNKVLLDLDYIKVQDIQEDYDDDDED